MGNHFLVVCTSQNWPSSGEPARAGRSIHKRLCDCRAQHGWWWWESERNLTLTPARCRRPCISTPPIHPRGAAASDSPTECHGRSRSVICRHAYCSHGASTFAITGCLPKQNIRIWDAGCASRHSLPLWATTCKLLPARRTCVLILLFRFDLLSPPLS